MDYISRRNEKPRCKNARNLLNKYDRDRDRDMDYLDDLATKHNYNLYDPEEILQQWLIDIDPE